MLMRMQRDQKNSKTEFLLTGQTFQMTLKIKKN